ncbi:unnamed protein product [Rhizophagus irregularis]|nr:unnamed protein product [Rhizophagus irregularis]
MQESEVLNISNIQLEAEKVVPIGKLEKTPEREHIIITEEELHANTDIQKNSIQYIYQNNTLFRKTKDGIRKVILYKQVEPILYHFHTDMSSAHLGIDAIIGKSKTNIIGHTCNICQRRGPINQ